MYSFRFIVFSVYTKKNTENIHWVYIYLYHLSFIFILSIMPYLSSKMFEVLMSIRRLFPAYSSQDKKATSYLANVHMLMCTCTPTNWNSLLLKGWGLETEKQVFHAEKVWVWSWEPPDSPPSFPRNSLEHKVGSSTWGLPGVDQNNKGKQKEMKL